MACLSQDLEAIRNPDEVLENPQDFFDPSQPVFSTDRVRPRRSPAPALPLATSCCHRPSPAHMHCTSALIHVHS